MTSNHFIVVVVVIVVGVVTIVVFGAVVVYCCYCYCFPGYRAFVHDQDGSYFLPALCSTLKEGVGWSLWDIVTSVNRHIATMPLGFNGNDAGQCPEAVSTLSTDYVFNKTTGPAQGMRLCSSKHLCNFFG